MDSGKFFGVRGSASVGTLLLNGATIDMDVPVVPAPLTAVPDGPSAGAGENDLRLVSVQKSGRLEDTEADPIADVGLDPVPVDDIRPGRNPNADDPVIVCPPAIDVGHGKRVDADVIRGRLNAAARQGRPASEAQTNNQNEGVSHGNLSE